MNPAPPRHPAAARCAALLAVGLLSTAPASAQDDADARFRAGVDALQRGDYPGAAEAFELSYRLAPRAAAMCNLALTFDRWGAGHEREAAERYERCAAEDDTGRFRDHATQRAAEIRASLPAETAPPPTPNPFASGASPPPPAPARPPPPPPPTPRRSRALLWAGLSIAAAGGAVLAGGAILAGGAADDEDALLIRHPSRNIPASETDDVELLADARRRRDRARILYVVGGLTAGLGVALVFVDLLSPSGPPPRATITVGAAPGGGVLGARVRF